MAAKRNLNNSTDEAKARTSGSSGKTRKKDQTIEDKQRELSERCKNDIEKELKSKKKKKLYNSFRHRCSYGAVYDYRFYRQP